MTKNKRQKLFRSRKGAALLIVLGVVMVVTIVALAYLSRSDNELQYGQNMLLRTKADYLAESALEHARGLILNPQEVSGEYWTGDTSQQLEASDFYYDVSVAPVDPLFPPYYWCNYDISCQAYRLVNSERTAQSSLYALLRLNPCIAYYSGTTYKSRMGSGTLVFGDVYCGGDLDILVSVDGDAFCANYTGTITGQHKQPEELSLEWPRVDANDFLNNYSADVVMISSPLNGPTTLSGICYYDGDLEIGSSVEITGMLIVEGDLQINGFNNWIRAGKALPALLVKGNLRTEQFSELNIEGLAVIDGKVSINIGTTTFNVTGAVFARNGIFETTADSVAANDAAIAGDPQWLSWGGKVGGAAGFNGSSDKLEQYDAAGYLNGLSAITIACWVKSDVTNQDHGIFYTKSPNGVDEVLGLRYDKAGSTATQCITASLKTNIGETQIQSGSNQQVSGWQHLALVWSDGNNITLYINGAEDILSVSGAALDGTTAGVEKFMLGCGAAGQYWDGLIDDVRIYNQALTAEDVNDIMNGIGTSSGLIAHWKLDESPMCSVMITAAPTKTAIWCWSESGDRKKWSQAWGAFYKVIRRD